MKRYLVAVMAVGLLAVQVPAVHAVYTSAASAVLMDANSGRVLYEQNSREPRLIASITKLMTAYVALESGHSLDEVVTIQSDWVGVEGSSVYLRAGEQVTLETLLYGMLLRSGNDAALAVACFCGGSEEAFVARMNEAAQRLGMENSHFSNPHGLNAEGHYSSAYDMALLARACLENETLTQVVSTKSITLGTRTFTNHNKLLWQYEGCIGLKTGYTEKAGRTLVSAARRDGLTLICVTLSDPNDWSDHAALFNYGFSQYRAEQLTQKGQVLCRLPVEGSLVPFCPVVATEDVSAALTDGEQIDVRFDLTCQSLCAPVTAGTILGEAVYLRNDQEVGRVALAAGDTISQDLASKQGLWERLKLELSA